MRCLQCGKKLSLLRKMANGGFCSAEHRDLYRRNEAKIALARLRESQVRIERPSPAAAAAALAAVERLRAMDSSADDPQFVETYQFVERVHPRNFRRVMSPVIQPLDALRYRALPEWGFQRAALSFPASRCVAERTELVPALISDRRQIPPVPAPFRSDLRLPASCTGQLHGRMGSAGLLDLPTQTPVERTDRRLEAHLEQSTSPLATPGGIPRVPRTIPAMGPTLQMDQLGAEAILPLPSNVITLPELTLAALRSLAARIPSTPALPLSVQACPGEPDEQRDRDPAQVQSLEALSLRAANVAAEPRLSLAALSSVLNTSMPSPPNSPAEPLSLRHRDQSEPVQLQSSDLRIAACVAPQAFTSSRTESSPALSSLSAPRMRAEEAMQSLSLHSAAGSLRVLDSAINSASDLLATLPTPDTQAGSAGLSQEFAMLAVAAPDPTGGDPLRHTPNASPEVRLDTVLPAHGDVCARLPRERAALVFEPLVFQSTPAQPITLPLAMCATAAAGSPAIPNLRVGTEEIEVRRSNSVVPDPEELSGEPVPPAIERQLPLALGRAINGEVQPCRMPDVCQSAFWKQSVDHPPAIPHVRLKTDHADGSGSRQARAAASRAQRSHLPSIDLHRLPGRRFWTYAPADLKWVALGLPIILVFVVYSFRGSRPKTDQAPQALASIQSTQPKPAALAAAEATSNSITNSLRQVLVTRAAVNLVDDFRGGLGAWQGDPGWAKSWRYGQATFLEPGSLALFKPSLELRDYSLEFLAQIQGRSLNWVFRAKDSKNFYAMRIVVRGSGPMPDSQIIQYAVINGKEERSKVLPTPYPVRTDTMYLVRVDVRGNEFNVYLQGQLMYNFTDDRLQEGGIGFFSPKGDKSYLRWVQIKHQYDYLGRLCALLAPYQVPPEAAKSE